MATQQFRLAITQWAKNTAAQKDALARQSIQELAKVIVEDTPVDTGFLRGQWQPAINAMATTTKAEPADKAGAMVGAKVAAMVIGMKAGDTFYMSNNASYALRLEYGFVGEDAAGRKVHAAGRYFVTGAAAKWPAIVAAQAQALGLTPGRRNTQYDL